MRRSNSVAFWSVAAAITALDVASKWWAQAGLLPQRLPHSIAGDWLRLTLVYNPGAAFGLQVGAQSRWVFMGLTVVALGILGRLYLNTRPGDLLRTASLGLVCGGALGNLIDRVRSDHGVVDFIDIGVGTSRWPTFNVADVAVSVGAVVLAWTLWDSEQSESAVASTTLAAAESGELT
jgi:signal peptidase II